MTTWIPENTLVNKDGNEIQRSIPIGSMYGIYAYIWLEFILNVGKYTIHGSSGIYNSLSLRNSSL